MVAGSRGRGSKLCSISDESSWGENPLAGRSREIRVRDRTSALKPNPPPQPPRGPTGAPSASPFRSLLRYVYILTAVSPSSVSRSPLPSQPAHADASPVNSSPGKSCCYCCAVLTFSRAESFNKLNRPRSAVYIYTISYHPRAYIIIL